MARALADLVVDHHSQPSSHLHLSLFAGTIEAMLRFSDLWMLGGPAGTPARSLQTVVMYMYQTAFESNDFNLGLSRRHFICRCTNS